MIDFLVSNLIARSAFLALLFAIVMAAVLAGIRAASRRAAVRADLKEIARTGTPAGRARLEDRKETGWTRLADRIETAGLSLTDTKSDKLRQKLIAAGYTSPVSNRHHDEDPLERQYQPVCSGKLRQAF